MKILVVDDGSIDNTAEVAAGAALADEVTLRCLVHDRNRGKGAAVRTGFAVHANRVICGTNRAAQCNERAASSISGIK